MEENRHDGSFGEKIKPEVVETKPIITQPKHEMSGLREEVDKSTINVFLEIYKTLWKYTEKLYGKKYANRLFKQIREKYPIYSDIDSSLKVNNEAEFLLEIVQEISKIPLEKDDTVFGFGDIKCGGLHPP